MDDERRLLERRRAAGEDVSRELERLRRRQLGSLDCAVLRLCMAAKVSWGVNLNRADRAVITRLLVGAMNERAACDWKAGMPLVQSRRVQVRGVSVNPQTSADGGGVVLTLHKRGTKWQTTQVIFARETIDDLASRYPSPLVEALPNGVRLDPNAILRGMRDDFSRAYEQMRGFQNTPGTPIGTNFAQARAEIHGFNEGVGRLSDVRWFLPPTVKSWAHEPAPGPALVRAVEEIGRGFALDMERRAMSLLFAPNDAPPDALPLYTAKDEGLPRFGVTGPNVTTRSDRGPGADQSPPPPSR